MSFSKCFFLKKLMDTAPYAFDGGELLLHRRLLAGHVFHGGLELV
jgi:hypothetical protein